MFVRQPHASRNAGLYICRSVYLPWARRQGTKTSYHLVQIRNHRQQAFQSSV